MLTNPGFAALEVMPAATRPGAVRLFGEAADYWALTKPEINFLIAIATFTGFYLGRPAQLHRFPFMLLMHRIQARGTSLPRPAERPLE